MDAFIDLDTILSTLCLVSFQQKVSFLYEKKTKSFFNNQILMFFWAVHTQSDQSILGDSSGVETRIALFYLIFYIINRPNG